MSGLRVIGDIGGTNARFAVAEDGRYGELRHVEVSKYPSLHDALTDYLSALPGAKRPTAAALDIAGPVFGDVVGLTNAGWRFSIAELRQSLALSTLKVVNDFAAAAISVPYLPKQDLFTVGPPCPEATGTIGVIGPGTGLGVGGLLPNASAMAAVVGRGRPRHPADSDARGGGDRSPAAIPVWPRLGGAGAFGRGPGQSL